MSNRNCEILFRGRIIGEDEWVQGYYVCLNGKAHRIYPGFAEVDCGIYFPDFYTVDPKTVGQFTGLTDKNGKKIFEGDIVTAHEHYGYIAMDTDYWEIHWNNNFSRGLYVWQDAIEVIGNIHDNPELLEANNE